MSTTPWKKSSYMIEWIAPTDPLKELSHDGQKNEWPVATPLFK